MKLLTSIVCICVLFLTGCEKSASEKAKVKLDELKTISKAEWDALALKKIYFGHQSVGFDLITGMNNVMKEMPEIKLHIKETKLPEDFSQPIFAHSKIGKNRDPKGKCDDFRAVMDSGVGNKVDIAFVKLCFVDIMKGTNAADVFKHYGKTMDGLRAAYPKVQFFALTAPLTAYENSTLVRIKRLFGFTLSNDEDNIVRNDFNKLVRAKYQATGDLFDLAGFESTRMDGRRVVFNKNGGDYFSMADEWTHDGGHFNEGGGKYMAKKLLLFLVEHEKKAK